MQAHAHAVSPDPTSPTDISQPDTSPTDMPPHAARSASAAPDRSTPEAPGEPPFEQGEKASPTHDAPTLRIVGLTRDGDRVVCALEDPKSTPTTERDDTDGPRGGRAANGGAHPAAGYTAAKGAAGDPTEARFTLPIDERLRAAVRGDLGSAAEGEINMTPGLRPREIQSRIRAGASVEQVAAAAGCPAERIESYAYPVLLERATIAERARAARPLKGVGGTLEEIVTETLADRGQQHGLQWDAFKDERGWTVTLTWQAGRSENRAEWAFTARPGGGAVASRNSAAADLLEPGQIGLRPVDQVRTAGDVPAAGIGTRRDTAGSVSAPHGSATPATRATEAPDSVLFGADGEIPEADRTAEQHSSAAASKDVHTAPESGKRSSRRGQRPQMPSWEDVLLGTRTAEH